MSSPAGPPPPETARRIRRILVALDASPSSIEALKAAAHLATLLDAELDGLYVQDESMLRGVELPITRVVGSFSGTIRSVGRREIERSLENRAARAQQALESVAAQARVHSTFRIARGVVAEEVLSAASGADMVSVGRCGWSLVEGRRIGGTTERLLAHGHVHVLILPRQIRPGSAVVILYDGGSASAVGLEVATALARQDATPLIVVLVVADPERGKALEAEARQSLAASGIHRNVTWRMIPRKDPAMLAGAVRAEGTGLLILPVEDTPERVSREFLSLLDVPALIVR